MSILKKALAFSIFITLCGTVNASGFSSFTMIVQTITNDAHTEVRVAGVTSNPDQCLNTNGYTLETMQSNYAAMMSTLLSAQLARKTVRFLISGCGSNNLPKITSITLNSN